MLACRLNLNYPPTAVGGIMSFTEYRDKPPFRTCKFPGL